MNRIALTLTGLVFAAGAAHADDCVAPQTPAVPDGKTASWEEMVATMEDVKAFQAANLEYQGCLDSEINEVKAKANAEDASEKDKAMWKELVQANNNAFTREKKLVEQFNSEREAFNAANDSGG